MAFCFWDCKGTKVFWNCNTFQRFFDWLYWMSVNIPLNCPGLSEGTFFCHSGRGGGCWGWLLYPGACRIFVKHWLIDRYKISPCFSPFQKGLWSMARFYNQLIVLTLRTNAMLQSSEVPDFRGTGPQGVPDYKSPGFQKSRIPVVPDFRNARFQEFRNAGFQEFPSAGFQ